LAASPPFVSAAQPPLRITLLGDDEGPPRRRPLESGWLERYGVTVSVCTTWVIPGVTLDVMLAVES
jgi:hypothetical protein